MELNFNHQSNQGGIYAIDEKRTIVNLDGIAKVVN